MTDSTYLRPNEVLAEVAGLQREPLSRWTRQGYVRAEIRVIEGRKTSVYPRVEVEKLKRAFALVSEGYSPRRAFEKARPTTNGLTAGKNDAPMNLDEHDKLTIEGALRAIERERADAEDPRSRRRTRDEEVPRFQSVLEEKSWSLRKLLYILMTYMHEGVTNAETMMTISPRLPGTVFRRIAAYFQYMSEHPAMWDSPNNGFSEVVGLVALLEKLGPPLAPRSERTRAGDTDRQTDAGSEEPRARPSVRSHSNKP